ncbi:hypothetical protein MBLNU459_g1740t1 [Dothideomycetes sp. NU459]
MTEKITRSQQEADLKEYHSLIATGLGCIESVLKNWKFPDPKIEARLQLRYAGLLFDETDNETEAQELLIKGITLCERHRLLDLKYSMMHLQARFHFRSKPRAAMKMLDQLIPTLEAYKHTCWVYAFRFLRVSFYLHSAQQPDLALALQQLQSISTLAEHHRHYSILATAATLEALINLRSLDEDAIELSQRAIAATRKHQLDPGVAALPQLTMLIKCLDLCCDLVLLSPEQSKNKMWEMQRFMDHISRDKAVWRSDGSFCVPVGDVATADVDDDSNGIFERTSTGQRGLVFSWIRKSELHALGYLISGVTATNLNGEDPKVEKYLAEGSKISKVTYDASDEQKVQSLSVANACRKRRAHIHLLMRLQLVFAKCGRSAWDEAWQVVEPLATDIEARSRNSTDPVVLTTLYLTGLIKQATGDLTGALRIFTCRALDIDHKDSLGSNMDELRILSALNTVLIRGGSDSGQDKAKVGMLLTRLEPACAKSDNLSLRAAYYIAASSSQASLPIIKTKQFLSLASSSATKVGNEQLRCMVMNLMTEKFFTDIVGDQAKTSARATKQRAIKARSPLWQAVAGNMLSKTLEIEGSKEDAAAQRAQAEAVMRTLPKGLRRALQEEDDDDDVAMTA